jgi:YjbE family integral membrane protein
MPFSAIWALSAVLVVPFAADVAGPITAWAVLQIIMIDVLLGGDNAVVIALAVRSLPPVQQRKAMIAGASIAVGLRIILTFFASQLLGIQFLKLAGGLAIFWIAVKLLIDAEPESEDSVKEAKTIWQAMWIILVADLTMSVDNVLAVAGASNGNVWLLIFGLVMSIPFIIFASGMLSKLMERYPIIIIIGSMILGRVGAEMILTDPWVVKQTHITGWPKYAIEAACAIGVVVLGKVLAKRR